VARHSPRSVTSGPVPEWYVTAEEPA